MIDLLIVILIISFILYYLIILKYDAKLKETRPKEKKIETDNKFEPLLVYLKSLPNNTDFKFKHQKLTKRMKPSNKDYYTTDKVQYVCLNKILRHFYLSENPNKTEIMNLTYIPDNFDFHKFNDNNKFKSFSETHNQMSILPNKLAEVADELNGYLEKDFNEDVEKITYKKNKITLMTDDKFYLNIKYTTFPKPEYDISAMNDNIIESVLKLKKIQIKTNSKVKKKKYVYYIKFSNDYYLCINKDGIFYASKDSNRIFYFDICIYDPKTQKFLN